MMWKTTFRWRACAAIAGVCLLAGATDALACKPEPLSMNAQGADICYGKEVWQEPTLGGRWLDQDFNLYRVPSTVPVPLIVWAHPNGMSKGLPPLRRPTRRSWCRPCRRDFRSHRSSSDTRS